MIDEKIIILSQSIRLRITWLKYEGVLFYEFLIPRFFSYGCYVSLLATGKTIFTFEAGKAKQRHRPREIFLFWFFEKNVADFSAGMLKNIGWGNWFDDVWSAAIGGDVDSWKIDKKKNE